MNPLQAALHAVIARETAENRFVTMERHMSENAWQPIETAPKDGTLIDIWLVDDDDPSGIGVRFCDVRWLDLGRRGAGWWSPDLMHGDGNHIQNEDYIATHWMPLPAPPASPE